jgi:hypothetical protein
VSARHAQPNYTIKAAAKQLNCSTRTIERWIRKGMACREVAGIVVIDDAVLMARFRQWMTDNPRMKITRGAPNG